MLSAAILDAIFPGQVSDPYNLDPRQQAGEVSEIIRGRGPSYNSPYVGCSQAVFQTDVSRVLCIALELLEAGSSFCKFQERTLEE